MADTLQEAIEELMSRSTAEDSSGSVLVINGNLRTISIPKNFIFGVYNDANVLSVPFEMPRHYAGNDLSEFSIRVNYVSATNVGGIYEVEDPVVGEDKITFEWLTSRGVFLGAGDVVFNVCLRKMSENDEVVKEYNTTLGRGSVLAGLEIDDPEDPEAISIYTHMRELEASAKQSAESAEGYALGTQDGEPVDSDSPYYHANAKWYIEEYMLTLMTTAETAAILNE